MTSNCTILFYTLVYLCRFTFYFLYIYGWVCFVCEANVHFLRRLYQRGHIPFCKRFGMDASRVQWLWNAFLLAVKDFCSALTRTMHFLATDTENCFDYLAYVEIQNGNSMVRKVAMQFEPYYKPYFWSSSILITFNHRVVSSMIYHVGELHLFRACTIARTNQRTSSFVKKALRVASALNCHVSIVSSENNFNHRTREKANWLNVETFLWQLDLID